MMKFAEFMATDPDTLNGVLLALWWDAQGDWNRAHEIAQEIEDADGSWVHAYLHRKEGDLGNAGYWYRRAGRRPADGSLGAEWEEMVKVLLESRTV